MAVITRTQGATGAAGMVSSAHQLATLAGVEVLEKGGNAFDAAIAVAAVLTVVEPTSSNLFGGYGSLLIYDAKIGKTRYLDSNGFFPRNVNTDVFRPPANRRQMIRSAKAVSTPGTLNGFETLWRAYGTLAWPHLLERAIYYADRGFTVDDRLAEAIQRNWPHFSDYTKTIYAASGKPLKAGEQLVQHDLAASFRIAARDGAKSVHGGVLGRAIAEEMKRRDGFLSLEDLRANRAEWFEPIRIDYRGYEVVTAGPPSNSFAALLSLGIMSRFDVRALGHNTTAYLHRFAEATKHAFWARLRYAGGPEANAPPLDRLLSEAYWHEQAAQIDLEQASTFTPPTFEPTEGSNTTHFVVADQWGNIVSATLTLGRNFGSTVMATGTGIWLNNSLAYAVFEPKGNPMDALPGRRKHSSKTPTLIFKQGRPWVAIGTPGGHTIPQSVAQMVINLVDFEMDLQAALDAPRIAFVTPHWLLAEADIPEAVRGELVSMGHQIPKWRGGLGRANALSVLYTADGTLAQFTGASDRRADGYALGVTKAQGINPPKTPSLLMVVHKGSDRLEFIDPATQQILGHAKTGFAPHEVAVVPAKQLAYVTDYGTGNQPGHTLSVIDVSRRQTINTIDLMPYTRPHGIVASSDGARLYVTCEGQQALVVVDTQLQRVSHAIRTEQPGSHMVAISPDERQAYVTNFRTDTLTVIDLTERQVQQHIVVGEGAEGFAISPDGSAVFVASREINRLTRINTSTGAVEQQVQTDRFPIRAQVTPDGRYILVSALFQGSVQVFTTQDLKLVKRIEIGGAPLGILMTPDGRTAYVAQPPNNRVTEVDLNTWEVRSHFQSQHRPDGMAYLSPSPS
ncbi:MAG: hypothetical protein ETSY1_18685 [Candidatus Entotheonella factor]|uniref:Gamma-glutamyltransferase n=1 Tax=Entotheonella factor TaxID=1429438 RepID=W4LL61_ENTF1|nr:MAG: hypothetical protein ETSY1_18685 [Candidatus Entotheonella factor]